MAELHQASLSTQESNSSSKWKLRFERFRQAVVQVGGTITKFFSVNPEDELEILPDIGKVPANATSPNSLENEISFSNHHAEQFVPESFHDNCGDLIEETSRQLTEDVPVSFASIQSQEFLPETSVSTLAGSTRQDKAQSDSSISSFETSIDRNDQVIAKKDPDSIGQQNHKVTNEDESSADIDSEEVYTECRTILDVEQEELWNEEDESENINKNDSATNRLLAEAPSDITNNNRYMDADLLAASLELSDKGQRQFQTPDLDHIGSNQPNDSTKQPDKRVNAEHLGQEGCFGEGCKRDGEETLKDFEVAEKQKENDIRNGRKVIGEESSESRTSLPSEEKEGVLRDQTERETEELRVLENGLQVDEEEGGEMRTQKEGITPGDEDGEKLIQQIVPEVDDGEIRFQQNREKGEIQQEIDSPQHYKGGKRIRETRLQDKVAESGWEIGGKDLKEEVAVGLEKNEQDIRNDEMHDEDNEVTDSKMIKTIEMGELEEMEVNSDVHANVNDEDRSVHVDPKNLNDGKGKEDAEKEEKEEEIKKNEFKEQEENKEHRHLIKDDENGTKEKAGKSAMELKGELEHSKETFLSQSDSLSLQKTKEESRRSSSNTQSTAKRPDEKDCNNLSVSNELAKEIFKSLESNPEKFKREEECDNGGETEVSAEELISNNGGEGNELPVEDILKMATEAVKTGAFCDIDADPVEDQTKENSPVDLSRLKCQFAVGGTRIDSLADHSINTDGGMFIGKQNNLRGCSNYAKTSKKAQSSNTDGGMTISQQTNWTEKTTSNKKRRNRKETNETEVMLTKEEEGGEEEEVVEEIVAHQRTKVRSCRSQSTEELQVRKKQAAKRLSGRLPKLLSNPTSVDTHGGMFVGSMTNHGKVKNIQEGRTILTFDEFGEPSPKQSHSDSTKESEGIISNTSYNAAEVNQSARRVNVERRNDDLEDVKEFEKDRVGFKPLLERQQEENGYVENDKERKINNKVVNNGVNPNDVDAEETESDSEDEDFMTANIWNVKNRSDFDEEEYNKSDDTDEEELRSIDNDVERGSSGEYEGVEGYDEDKGVIASSKEDKHNDGDKQVVLNNEEVFESCDDEQEQARKNYEGKVGSDNSRRNNKISEGRTEDMKMNIGDDEEEAIGYYAVKELSAEYKGDGNEAEGQSVPVDDSGSGDRMSRQNIFNALDKEIKDTKTDDKELLVGVDSFADAEKEPHQTEIFSNKRAIPREPGINLEQEESEDVKIANLKKTEREPIKCRTRRNILKEGFNKTEVYHTRPEDTGSELKIAGKYKYQTGSEERGPETYKEDKKQSVKEGPDIKHADGRGKNEQEEKGNEKGAEDCRNRRASPVNDKGNCNGNNLEYERPKCTSAEISEECPEEDGRLVKPYENGMNFGKEMSFAQEPLLSEDKEALLCDDVNKGREYFQQDRRELGEYDDFCEDDSSLEKCKHEDSDLDQEQSLRDGVLKQNAYSVGTSRTEKNRSKIMENETEAPGCYSYSEQALAGELKQRELVCFPDGSEVLQDDIDDYVFEQVHRKEEDVQREASLGQQVQFTDATVAFEQVESEEFNCERTLKKQIGFLNERAQFEEETSFKEATDTEDLGCDKKFRKNVIGNEIDNFSEQEQLREVTGDRIDNFSEQEQLREVIGDRIDNLNQQEQFREVIPVKTETDVFNYEKAFQKEQQLQFIDSNAALEKSGLEDFKCKNALQTERTLEETDDSKQHHTENSPALPKLGDTYCEEERNKEKNVERVVSPRDDQLHFKDAIPFLEETQAEGFKCEEAIKENITLENADSFDQRVLLDDPISFLEETESEGVKDAKPIQNEPIDEGKENINRLELFLEETPNLQTGSSSCVEAHQKEATVMEYFNHWERNETLAPSESKAKCEEAFELDPSAKEMNRISQIWTECIEEEKEDKFKWQAVENQPLLERSETVNQLWGERKEEKRSEFNQVPVTFEEPTHKTKGMNYLSNGCADEYKCCFNYENITLTEATVNREEEKEGSHSSNNVYSVPLKTNEPKQCYEQKNMEFHVGVEEEAVNTDEVSFEAERPQIVLSNEDDEFERCFSRLDEMALFNSHWKTFPIRLIFKDFFPLTNTTPSPDIVTKFCF